MSLRDKIEHAIQNQPCTVKDLKARFGGDRGADRKVMEALDALVHEAVVCQRSGVFFTVRSGRAEKALLCKVVKLGKNFAFVMLEDETSDIFIPGRFTRGAMPGDEVLVEKFEHPRVEGSDEGEILAVLEEKNDLVGTVRRVDGTDGVSAAKCKYAHASNIGGCMGILSSRNGSCGRRTRVIHIPGVSPWCGRTRVLLCGPSRQKIIPRERWRRSSEP